MVSVKEINLVRSKRKTVAISVDLQGKVIFRIPYKLAANEVSEIFKKKLPWIEKKLTRVRQIKEQQILQDKGQFYFLGEKYSLQVSNDYFRGVLFFDNKYFFSKYFEKQLKSELVYWYKKRAKILVVEKVNNWASLMGAKFSSVKVNGAVTRLGSCSEVNSLNFSWRLVLAPEFVFDYVVIHELAHTFHHNHSKSFWLTVYKFSPEFKTAKYWINQNISKLMF